MMNGRLAYECNEYYYALCALEANMKINQPMGNDKLYITQTNETIIAGYKSPRKTFAVLRTKQYYIYMKTSVWRGTSGYLQLDFFPSLRLFNTTLRNTEVFLSKRDGAEQIILACERYF